ncbi:MAG: STELLO glycosyltransferase family protein [Actinomycetota bacterium]
MNFLVITTINKPTTAIIQYQDILLKSGWKIIIVGDKKTPQEFADFPGVDYLSIERQLELFGELASLIPFNHYARKNLGYLYAMNLGATFIAETDDDNIPYLERYPNFLPARIKVPLLEEQGAANIYSYFTDRIVWPRGLPLDKIKTPVNFDLIEEQEVSCYIQQGLADRDPDVDAIYRLTLANEDVIFAADKKLALAEKCYCPFNSQNTCFYKEAFPFMLLPVGVSSRVTDIWRGYIAQKLLWCMGAHLLFLSPSVYQIRNIHNLVKDFNEEVPLYTQAQELMNLLNDFTPPVTSACDLMLAVYDYLQGHKLLSEIELKLCQLWIAEVKNYL